METDYTNNQNSDKNNDSKIVPANMPASFPGESKRNSLDEDIDPSIIKNKPKKERDEESSNGAIKRIRTYKEDIASAVQKQKASLTSIVAAEQIRRTHTTGNTATKPKRDIKKIGIILVGIIFILLGIGVVTFLAFFYQKEEVTIKETVPSFIFVEKQKEIDITEKTSREILQTLGSERANTFLPLGQIAHLYVTETTKELETDVTRIISAEEFLTNIRAQVNGAFLRSLDPSFMLGIHVFNQNQPFIIFKSNSYQHSFAGLLEWEKTMYHDLFLFTGLKNDPILGVPVNPQTGREIILSDTFEDRIIQNIDVRALVSDTGEIKFLYAFPNQQTLIITTNENTLTEIITRLNSVRIF